MLPVTARTIIGTLLAKRFRNEYYAQRNQQQTQQHPPQIHVQQQQQQPQNRF